jgi:uncharacterized membrane protein (DUF2068 family)
MRSPRNRLRIQPGLRAIIAYKFTRAAAALVASGVLAAFTATGHTGLLNEEATRIRDHVTSAWSIELADVLIHAVMPRQLWIVAAALALDGASAFVEGWSLRQRWSWGPWLVVVATGTFLPFEVFALLRRFSVARALLLGLNVVVALYLTWHAMRSGQREGNPSRPGRSSSSVDLRRPRA